MHLDRTPEPVLQRKFRVVEKPGYLRGGNFRIDQIEFWGGRALALG